MDEMILKDDAIKLIEGFQREICPVGMWGRHSVYGKDRDKFDDWQFIIDELEKLPSEDIASVVHGRWVEEPDRRNHWHCSECGFVIGVMRLQVKYCPNCGAKMEDLWNKID